MSTNPHQPDTHPNGVVTTATSDPPHPPGFLPPSTTTTTTSSKRQRRPSVRLGDIGEQPASAIPHESYIRRCKQLNLPIPPQYLVNHNTKPVPSASKAPPRTPSVKRRLNSNFEAPREDRGFERERESDSYAAGYEDDADVEVEDAPSETDGGNWSVVGKWLEGLGLGKYRPVFEIHEVDEEVLGLLTLDDLKEMGISAVGSRRKMYSAIQSLRNNNNNNNSNSDGNKTSR